MAARDLGERAAALRVGSPGGARSHWKELVTFETADEDLAFLNTEIAAALGSAVDGQLELTMYLVKN